MNLKKKVKGFFTLTRKSEGFTLVELIVVIAILAILAGVAVPAYNGYIKKADRSADDALLNEINTAFASACMANGVSNFGMNPADVKAEIDDTSKKFVYTEPFVTEFEKFFEGEDQAFKVFTSLAYNPTTGVFAEGEYVTINGFTISVSKELADAMKNNNFSALGGGVLTEKVGKISDVASILIGLTDDVTGLPTGTFANMVFKQVDDEYVYLTGLQKSLGMSEEQFASVFMNEDGSFNNEALGNSLVLSAAQKTQGMDTGFLSTDGFVSQLRSELDSEDPEKSTQAMAKLALTYGMYTTYVKETGAEDKSQALLEQGSFTGMTNILKDVESEEFRKYLNSSKGQADLNAYMASMQVINDSANQSTDATMDILTKGFTDPELVKAINSLMGNTQG